jgi:cytochrome c-type biogenesis protein CcmE
MSTRSLQRFVQCVLALASGVLIAACGGGDGAGELGSGGTGVGTVTGFGSIYVDGARFDDSNATVQSDDEAAPDQAPVPAEAKLGQRVEIDFETDGVARTVSVQATLVGAVTAKPGGNLTVLGQTVLINADPAHGPVTQLAPYATAAAIAVADIVEVHGVALWQGNGFVVQATRIEQRAALPQFLRVSGVVADLTVTGSTARFKVGALAVTMQNAAVLPPLRTLANGQSVVVWGRAADLNEAVVGAPVLAASLVRIRDRIASPQRGYLGGLVTGLAASRFSIGSVTVDAAGASITPNAAALADGKYVQVRGDFGSDGVLVATEVKVRDGSADGDLRGTVTNYSGADGSFRIRDVGVTLAAGVAFQNCLGDVVANGQFVEVKGSLGPAGIVAQTIKCMGGDPGGAIVERRGAAGQVQVLQRQFALTPSGGAPLVVRWKLLTFFRDVTPLTLDGKNLRVEGRLATDGALEATKISLDN